MEDGNRIGIFDKIIGEDGLKAGLTVQLDNSTLFKLSLVIVTSIVVGGLLGAISKTVIVGK